MVLINIIIALIVFSIIVMIHEFGHFIVAKKNGILVEEFAIGMGPKLFGKKKGDTLYSLRLLPIGGFCRMLGEEEDAEDDRAFNKKSVGARMAVIAAGPLMNFLLALVILLIFAFQFGYNDTHIDGLEPGFPAEQSGLQTGDKIIKINNTNMHIFQDVTYYLMGNQGKAFDVTVKRGDEKLTYNVIPRYNKDEKTWLIGIKSLRKKDNIFSMISSAFWEMLFYIKTTFVGLVGLITGKISKDQLAGPIGIVKVIGDQYQAGLKIGISAALQNVAYLVVVLSANLGALNLFPMPALDGSRLVFLAIEGVRKKPVSSNIENTIHLIGFGLLMVLMVFVAYNDIMRLFV